MRQLKAFAPHLFAVSLVAAFVALVANSSALAISALTILLMLMLVREYSFVGDVLTPIGITCLMAILLFVIRPIAFFANGVTNAASEMEAIRIDDALHSAGISSVLLSYAFFLGILASSAAMRPKTNKYISFWKTTDRATPSTHALNRARLLVVGAILVCLVAIGLLIQQGGGLKSYVEGLAYRSSFLAGSVFLTLTYLPLLVSLLNHLTLRTRAGKRSIDSVAVIGFLILLLTTLSGGGRAQVIFGCALPLVLFWHLCIKRISTKALIGGGASLVLVALLMGIFLRDAQFDSGQSLKELREKPIHMLTTRLTEGIESRPFDSVVLLANASSQDRLEHTYGQTYLTSAAFFVPRALWEGKPYGGGNAEFTSKYLPRFYGYKRIETSISAIGEGYLNFGPLGVLIVGGVFGFIAESFLRFRFAPRHLWKSVAYCAAVPAFATLLRGDAYHNLPLLISILTLAWLAAWVSGLRITGTATAREGKETRGQRESHQVST